MSERRNEFMAQLRKQGSEVDQSNLFLAARIESERIERRKSDARKNLANIRQENEDAKAFLKSGKDLSAPDAVFAAMNNSGRLREKLERAENELRDAEQDR